MASRQTFLKRDPFRPSPSPKPESGRRPFKRDPRVTPWRPAPKAPPIKPTFPGKRLPKPAFGKMPAHIPFPATLPGKLKPMLPFLRLHPLVGLGLLAWDLYKLWQWYQTQSQPAEYTDYVFCGDPMFPDFPGPFFGWQGSVPCVNSAPNPCTTPGCVNGNWTIVDAWYTRWHATRASASRGELIEGWYFPHAPTIPFGPDGIPLEEVPGVTMPFPMDVPYPYPYAPAPLPAHQPGIWPKPLPELLPPPVIVPPVAVVPSVPAITIRPDGSVRPDHHEIRQPLKNEREKKKRLTPGQTAAWLMAIGGGFTEMDDFIAAVYKGLPWQLRRWRGRDGVWRDRDHRTDRRLQRLYQEVGSLSINTAIKEVIKDQFSDAAYGKAGNQIKQSVQAAGKKGLYWGATGLQRGSNLHKKNWADLYQKLKADAAKLNPARFYRVKQRDPKTGEWRLVIKERPMTQIPWYRQESNYPRMARPGEAEYWQLSAAEKAARKKTVRRFYYGPGSSRRNNDGKGYDFKTWVLPR